MTLKEIMNEKTMAQEVLELEQVQDTYLDEMNLAILSGMVMKAKRYRELKDAKRYNKQVSDMIDFVETLGEI